MRPAGLSFHTVHRVTGCDDRSAWARAIVGVALLHPVGADERDGKIAIHVRSDDGLVVARNRPRERLLGIGGRGWGVAPSKAAVLSFDVVGGVDAAQARVISRGLRAAMMLTRAQPDRLALPLPG